MADVIKRIHSKGPFIQEEYVAGEAGIYPGMLLVLQSDGTVKKHAVSAGAVGDEKLFAMEDQLQGKTVDDVYTSGQLVTCIIPQKGAEVNMLLDDGKAVVIGGKIMSQGDGTVTANIAGKDILGVATKALDLTASANLINGLVPVRVSM